MEEKRLIEQAVAGDKGALEALLSPVQETAFNLALRMLGSVPDAEDAAQEILIKVMTSLASFQSRSAFSTWVFRIAVNHLRDYRKGMFSQHPLSFEIYGADIAGGREKDVPDLSGGVDRGLLERELKLSCTNVMLQCLAPESRCIFILGTMFRLDGRTAGEVLEMSPEAYRQRLSRARKKMAAFLKEYCGLAGGRCACRARVDYAVASRRIVPDNLAYSALEAEDGVLEPYLDAMEALDEASLRFPRYRATPDSKAFITALLRSESLCKITGE